LKSQLFNNRIAGDRQMAENPGNIEIEKPFSHHLARIIFAAFLFTFTTARVIVFLIMSKTLPDLYLYVGQTHIHHLNYGIFLLAGVGGYLVFRRPVGRSLEIAAILYGIGMALTFDEFGMWIHLGGGYWQRASWDAMTVLSGCFFLLAFAPSPKKFRPSHWLATIIAALAIVVFAILLVKSFNYAKKSIQPRLEKIETIAPK
jgi:hypothetical protein